VSECCVVNTSPLIFLGNAGFLDFLKIHEMPVIVPDAVIHELGLGSHYDDLVNLIQSQEWITIVKSPDPRDILRLWDLGPGEDSVLSYAMENPGSEIIVDDLQARRCARSLGIPVRGILGLVLLARKLGRIPAARPVLEKMREKGMYLSDAVLDIALRLVDE